MAVQLGAGCSGERQSPSAENRAAPTGALQERTSVQLRKDERLVLALGDSLYAGYGLGPRESFPAVLERELDRQGIPAKVINAGVSGDTSGGGLARLAFTLDGLERKPDLAIVGLGANDALRGIDPAETRRNLEAILTELKRRGIPALLTGMMAPRNMDNAYLRSFDPIYPELARKYDTKLDPFFLEGVISDPKLLLADGMHPNAAGIRKIADRVGPLVAGELRAVPAD
jgi:acyl-CoA thioesterase-1